jgi:predicted CoA-binding protein
VFQNPGIEQCCALLRRVKNIAVVGLSPNPDRPSYGVSAAMQGFGFRVIPVHPAATKILGEKVYSSLGSVPEPIDLVNVFRSAEFIDEVVDECLKLGLKSIWIQEGIVNEPAAERALAGGMMVVMNRCIYRDYRDYCR